MIARRGVAAPARRPDATQINLIPHYVRRPGVATVLLPPGLGDSHWVFLKLQGFLAARGFQSADAWVWDLGGPRRSKEYIQRIPFVRFVDYIDLRPNHKEINRLVHIPDAVSFLEGRWGFDFTIALNGWLEEGKDIAQAVDGSAVNWDYEIAETQAEQKFAAWHRDRGPWIVLYFSALAQAFQNWVKFVTPQRVTSLVASLQEIWPHHRFLFVGLPWDSGFAEKVRGTGIECLVGKTNPDEYFALLRGAGGAIGFANGNTILTTHFGVPTVMIWSSDRFPHMGFRTNWVRPGSAYLPVEIEDFEPSRIADALAGLVTSKEPICV